MATVRVWLSRMRVDGSRRGSFVEGVGIAVQALTPLKALTAMVTSTACPPLRAAGGTWCRDLCSCGPLRRAIEGVRAVALAAGIVACLVPMAGGCTSAQPGAPVIDEEELEAPDRPKSMRIASSFGGTHRKLEIAQGVWYQAFANRLVFLDAKTGTLLADLELAPRGTTGSLVDFVLAGERAYAVLEDDLVIEIDIQTVRAPRVLARWGVPELGILPKRVARIDGEIFVSGEGGVVRLREALAEGVEWRPEGVPEDEVTRPLPPRMLDGKSVGVVVGGVDGPVACVGRRITRLSDGTYLGSASHLLELPPEIGGYAFIVQTAEGARVGLMGRDFRERSTKALRGTVHSVRVFDDRFLAVNDFEVATWKLVREPSPSDPAPSDAGGAAAGAPAVPPLVLGDLLSVPVKGALDVGKVQPNRFAVSGSFGRALYRYLPEGDQPGDTFYWAERMPGRLDVAVSDRRRILASSREGAWLYLIGEKAEMIDKPIASPDRPLLEAEISWGTAGVSEDRTEVRFALEEVVRTYVPEHGARISTLAVADGKLWIGHDRGIDVVGFDPVLSEVVAEDRIRLGGPIIALYPNRVGGGVAYVAQYSGFGVVRPIYEDAPPIVTPGCVDGSDPKVRRSGAAGDEDDGEAEEPESRR